jgi:hypothetical protein
MTYGGGLQAAIEAGACLNLIRLRYGSATSWWIMVRAAGQLLAC